MFLVDLQKRLSSNQAENMTVTIRNSPSGTRTTSLISKSSTPQSSDDELITGKSAFKVSKPVKPKLSHEEKLKEKIRLQKLALQYEIKIREMKLKHSNIQKKGLIKKALTPMKKLTPKSPDENGPSKSVLCLEKIELGSDPIDLTSDADEKVTRRKSLMEINPSTKPDLEMKPHLARAAQTSGKENQFEINMPEGKAVAKILKMQVQ